ncbi:MAG TPA: fatty acid oxidation complex subunit alpha FadJ [Anaeromyxobacter sp.]|nr:fatty acid oxidation complex subunit alpha FadJ [Anaeromyxobacter sp.]
MIDERTLTAEAPTHALTNFRVETRNGVATLLLDVPGERVNTLQPSVMLEFVELMKRLEKDPAVKAVVLASAKPDGFVAGAKIEMMQSAKDAASIEKLARDGQAVFDALERWPKPVVAAIHGPCLGGGLELAMACHYRVAANDARTQLGQPEVQLGLIPGGGGTQRLPRLVGLQAGLDLILTGRSLKARRALHAGLVDEAVPPALLLEVARARAAALAAGKLRRERRAPKKNAIQRVTRIALEDNALGRELVFRQARKSVLAKTKGHYPAPLAALDAVEHGYARGFARGLEREAKLFGELAASDVAKRLIEIFVATTALKTDNGTDDPAVKPRPVERVGVLGGGLMGSGIAYVTVNAGTPVRLREKDDAAAARGLAAVRAVLDERVERRSIDRLERAEKMRLLTGATDWSGFERVDLVIEAVFEDLALKQEMVRAFEAVNASGIFASNTSSIPIGKIAEASRRPESVLGMHYFSPVHKMPLLEVIATPRTSKEAIATAVAIGKKQGKTVIVVGDGPGFYTSRILGPYMAEAGRLLMDGAAIEDVDRAIVRFGFPVGPVTLLDEVGVDVAAKVGKIMHAAFGERMPPPDALAGLVESGRLGRKSRKGFYTYDGKAKRVDQSVYDVVPGGRSRKSFPPQELQERIVFQMVNEAIRCLGEGILRSARDGDIGAVFGLGFPPFLGGPFRYADAIGTRALLERMEALAARHGARFEPAPLLVEKGRAGARFHG